MQIKPILSSLRRHKLIALLLALLAALTCAIVCNVAFMIAQHIQQIDVPSGVAEDQLVMLEVVNLHRGVNRLARHRADLAVLRALPGVKSAAAVDALPFNGNSWYTSTSVAPDGPIKASLVVFNGTPGELETLGLKLVAGRDFHANEYVPKSGDSGGLKHVPAAIVTRALAAQLFPGQSAVGKLIYPYDHGVRIVGVVAQLLRPGGGSGPDSNYTALFSMLPDDADLTYVLRSAPQDRARVLKLATAALNHLDANRVVRRGQSFTQLRGRHFQRDKTMISLLLASAFGLLFVAALGIAGLANFWVQQRVRSIGIRRAIGATRSNILHYFQIENALIISAGIALGVILAFAINLALMHYYELPRLPLWYLPIGAIALWLLGQLAVLGPALRASRVPPVVATRSV
ncbi:MAG: ABC transporter permease [Xanthomonadales bacterium]|nr:ABC transporter permease [Xanthomonadales bacterium]